MKYVIFAIAVIILWYIRSKIFAKIDKDEERALKTPGIAKNIRSHFPSLVEYLESIPGYHILFERNDMIQIGISTDDEYFAVNQYSGGLLIVYVRNSNVYKEWKFSRAENEWHIINQLKNYL